MKSHASRASLYKIRITGRQTTTKKIGFFHTIIMEISRDLAICMLFYVDYNEENVEKCKKKIKDVGNVEICYNTRPNEPVLVSIQRIRENPQAYHLYPEKNQRNF